MAIPYIPAADGPFDTWADNFQDLIDAAPATYGLSGGDATAITNAYTAWHAAYLAAVNPSTRTPVTVSAKDAARFVAEQLFRVYASQIRVNPGVLPEDKIALGLNLPNDSPSPISAPATWPLLSFLSAGPLSHRFSYKDSSDPEGKFKPYGVVHLALSAKLAAAPSTDPDGWPVVRYVTKSPFVIGWSAPDAGMIASYAGRWVNRNGLVGPWSDIVSHIVLGV